MKIIEINSPKHGRFKVQVDDEDYEYLSQFKWHIRKEKDTLYAGRTTARDKNGKQKTILIHREIMKIADSKILVDHIDHDGLNNQRENLRECTKVQNQQNERVDSDRTKNSTSKYKGVCWDKGSCKWRATINSRCHLGLFANEIDSARAYDRVAKELFGEFACLNFPDVEKSKEIAEI